MYITDQNGNTGVLIAKTWTGSEWIEIPERVMKDGFWWLINYFTLQLSVGLLYSFNVDNIATSYARVTTQYYFTSEPPIPI